MLRRASRHHLDEVEKDFPMPPPVRKDRKPFSLDEYDFKRTLGTGTFGRVRLVQSVADAKFYALKILKKATVVRLQQVEHIKNEIRLLSFISHPMIVNMLGFRQDEYKIYMLLDFVSGGEMFTHLRGQSRFTPGLAKFYAASIVLAFGYLHHHCIIYRDLKPENLLLTRQGFLKIADFGFAKVVQDKTWTLCGTPEYLAPEIIQSQGHGLSVDWWALGILIFEMLAGYPPYFDENPFTIYQKILHDRVAFPRHFDRHSKDLVRRLLQHDITRRLGCMRGGASRIQEHKWFEAMDWTALLNQEVEPPFVPECAGDGDASNFDEYAESDDDSLQPLMQDEREMFDDIEGGAEQDEYESKEEKTTA